MARRPTRRHAARGHRRFTGPDPAGGAACVESHEPKTFTRDNGIVEIQIQVPMPMADASCPTKRIEVTVEVGGLTDGATIAAGYSDSRYRLHGNRFELLPESTPCGRSDCSTPSPSPAPCTTDAYREALERDVDGSIRLNGDSRCDGSFLVVGIDTGSAGCPPTENQPSPCAKPKTAFFVARDGRWSIVTYGEGLTCSDVAEMTEIRFPESLCC